ncbi:response regulator [Priestia aryabhattai]
MNSNKIKLYIVDPNTTFITTIEGLFFEKDEFGINVIGSSTTNSAFEQDRQKIPQADIYIVSANLPDGTGIKIVEFLKKNSVTASKPIIFTIDKQTRNHATIARQRGVNKIFQKPFSIKELIQSIYTLTGSPLAESQSTPLAPETKPTSTKLVTRDSKPPQKKDKEAGSIFRPAPPTSPSPFKSSQKVKETKEEKKATKTPEKEIQNPFKTNKQDDLFNKIENNPLLNIQEVDTANDHQSNQAVKTIVTFTSVSSTGKTSLLVNVAYAIRKYAKIKPKICLLDLNLLFPSVAFHFLNNELKLARRDIYDISADLNYLNEDLLMEALTYHKPSGIYMLNTPAETEFIHKIGTIKAEQIERILVHLRDIFDVILIDTSNAITEDLVLFPMQFADKNLVVLEPNYLNVVGVNKFFYVLNRLEDSMKEPIISKTHILLNKETRNKSIYSDTARDFLYDKKFIARVPEDPKFIDFANKGKFIVDSDSIATSSIIDLANFIYPINPKDEKRKSKFPIFKK